MNRLGATSYRFLQPLLKTNSRNNGCKNLGQVFKNPGRAHAAANAHGDQAVPGAATFHLVEELDGQLGPGAAQGVAQGDGPAVDVDLLRVDTQFPDTGQGLGGKGLVDFKKVDSLSFLPVTFMSCGMAYMGPTPMISEGTPATAKPT